MAIKIGSQPVEVNGKEAVEALAEALSKVTKMQIDKSTIKVDGANDATGYTITATAAAKKPAKPAAKKAPPSVPFPKAS